jgi:hypothetical protein
MTTKDAFTPDEWTLVLQGPTGAGMYVVMSTKGGMLRETVAMSQAYAEARKQHGASELLDEIVAARPPREHTRYHSKDELRDAALSRLREAVALLAAKATPEEVEAYRGFVLDLSGRVAAAHREDEVTVSAGEAEAIRQVADALDAPAPQS